MTSQNNHQSKLIVLEGIDGSGTTTMVHLLSESLRGQGFKVALGYEPGSDDLSFCQEIRKMIFRTFSETSPLEQLLLFWVNRAYFFRTFVAPAMESDYIVVLDRSSPSTYAYQIFRSRGEARERIEHLFFYHDIDVRLGIVPDLVVFLDTSPEVAAARSQTKEAGTMVLSKIDNAVEAQRQLQAGYQHLASLGRPFLELNGICKKWVTIDSNPNLDTVFARLWKEISFVLGIPEKQ